MPSAANTGPPTSLGDASISPRARLGNGISLRLNFGWALLGNVVYQFCQWLIVVILAKSMSADVVGDFGLALAICTPITTFAGLSLTWVQSTDAADEFEFGHYLALRLISCAAALVGVAVISTTAQYPAPTRLLIILVGAGQIVQIFREIFTTHMQQQERMDLVSRSNMIHGFVSLLLFGGALWLTHSLLAAVLGLLGARLLTWLFWDIASVSRLMASRQRGCRPACMKPRWDWPRVRRLALLAAPLGLTSGLISLNASIPRYFIERELGKSALGYFVAVAALPSAGLLLIHAAGSSASPRLAKYYPENRSAFTRLVTRLVIFAAFFGASGVLIVFICGRPILALAFRPAYAAYNGLFLWLMVQAALAYVAAFLGNAMTAMRWFMWQPIVYAMAAATTTCAACWLVPRAGLTGAALSLIAGTTVQIGVSILVVRRTLRRRSM